jgi:hypothetical protein
MRLLWFVGAAIAVIPMFALGVFNGLTVVGLIVMGFATYQIIKKEGLA